MHSVFVFVVLLKLLSASGCNANSHRCICICCLGSMYYVSKHSIIWGVSFENYIDWHAVNAVMLYAVPPDNLDHLGLLYAACNTLDSGRQLV